MLDILVISPFRYALRKKCEAIKLQMAVDDNDDFMLHAVYALPADVSKRIHGKSFDFAYVDIFYLSEEISEVRDHLRGNKALKLF